MGQGNYPAIAAAWSAIPQETAEGAGGVMDRSVSLSSLVALYGDGTGHDP